MTLRAMIAAWLAALALVVATVWLIVAAAPPRTNVFAGYQVAVIGSSLMHHAVPGEGEDLGPGQRHLRYGISMISEAQALDLVDMALDARVRTVLIEANPLVRDFANTRAPRECDPGLAGLHARASTARLELVESARRLAGRTDVAASIGEPDRLDQPLFINPAEIARTYPLHFRAMSCPDRLAAQVRRGAAQGTRIMLVLPPRSPASARLLGRAADGQVRSGAQALADRLGIELVTSELGWSEDFFIDQSHLNRRGRSRFMAELATRDLVTP